MTSSESKKAIARLFNRLVDIAPDGAFRYPVALYVDEKTALAGRTEARACAASTKEAVYIAPKLLTASRGRQIGVLMHELGHVAFLQRGNEDHTEREADKKAEELWGAKISYDDEDVQTIESGTRPRPAHLDPCSECGVDPGETHRQDCSDGWDADGELGHGEGRRRNPAPAAVLDEYRSQLLQEGISQATVDTMVKFYDRMYPEPQGSYPERTAFPTVDLSDKRVVFLKKKYSGLEKQTQKVSDKPNGLWWASGDDWLSFAENFVPTKIRDANYLYGLRISDRVLRLATVTDVVVFTGEFGQYHGDEADILIDWAAVAKQYAGIEIIPYQYDLRRERGFEWYHTWDIASGCAWHPSAFLDVQLLQSRYKDNPLARRGSKKREAQEQEMDDLFSQHDFLATQWEKVDDEEIYPQALPYFAAAEKAYNERSPEGVRHAYATIKGLMRSIELATTPAEKEIQDEDERRQEERYSAYLDARKENPAEREVFTQPTQEEIVAVLRAHTLLKLRERVQRAFLIGSFAKGTQHEDSDVDILLEVSPKDGYSAEELTAKYRRALQQYFVRHDIRGKDDSVHPQWCGRRVDVYFTYDAAPERRPKILLSRGRK